MEEKLNINMLLVFKLWTSDKWILDLYRDIDLTQTVINTIYGHTYSREENEYLLNNKISECPQNYSSKPLLVYISKNFTRSELDILYRKLKYDMGNEVLYTYDEIKNTFVSPHIENTMVNTNIFMVFEHNLITNEPFILKDFTECDLAKFISSSRDEYKTICDRYIKRSIIEQLLSEHIYLDSEFDDVKDYIYAYFGREILLEEKEKLISSLSTAILSNKHFEVSEIQNMCCYKSGEEILKAKENSINKSIRKETEKKEQVKKKKNIIIEGLKEGVILNNKNYITDPAVGRELEVENLIISLAQDKKCPMLVGESGVGKTAIVDELVYMIQNDKIPSFLNNKVIVEVSASDLLAGTMYRGTLEEKLKKLFEIAEENDLILFIDEIHLMYSGNAVDDKINMASILRNHVDRFGLKVIGATTDEEYSKYFAGDSLKRRFDKIKVKEPDNTMLNMIIINIFEKFSKQYNISSCELLHNFPNIITNLIDLTNAKHRVRDDIVNNPDLVIGIIDKAYAYVKVCDKETLEIDHIIKSINLCDRIYDSAKKTIIERILDDKPIENEEPKCKIIQFNS